MKRASDNLAELRSAYSLSGYLLVAAIAAAAALFLIF